MNSVRSMHGIGDGLTALWRGLLGGRGLSRGAAWGLMIVGALAAFEIFNFSTTEFALRDVLGDLAFAGMRWSIVLAIAFCAMDFAGIARIFTPEARPGRTRRGLVPLRRLAAGCGLQRHPHLVGRLGRHRPPGQHQHQPAHERGPYTGRAGLRGRHGLADPRAHHRHILGGRRPDVLHRLRSASGQRAYAPSSGRSPVPSSPLRPVSAMPRTSVSTLRSAPKPSTPATFDRMEPTYQNVALDASASESGVRAPAAITAPPTKSEKTVAHVGDRLFLSTARVFVSYSFLHAMTRPLNDPH